MTCSLPEHFRYEEDFPSDYREALLSGNRDDHDEMIAAMMKVLPAQHIGELLSEVKKSFGSDVSMRELKFWDEETRKSKRAGVEAEAIGAKHKPDVAVRRVEGSSMTYEEFIDGVEKNAEYLLHLDIQKGDRVGLIAENSLDSQSYKFAIQSIGGVVVPWTGKIQDSGLSATEAMEKAKVRFIAVQNPNTLIHLLTDSQSRSYPLVRDAIEQKRIIGLSLFMQMLVARRVGQPALLNDVDTLEARQSSINWRDPALIMFSSGTGGMEAKQVMMTHGNIVYQSCVLPGMWKQPPGRRALHVLPQYHIFGEIVFDALLSGGADITLSDIRSLQRGKKNLFAGGDFQFMAGVPEIFGAIETDIRKGMRRTINRQQEEGEPPLHAVRRWVRSLIVRCGEVAFEEDSVRVAKTDVQKAHTIGNDALLRASERYWSPVLAERSKVRDAMIPLLSPIVALGRKTYPKIREKAHLDLELAVNGGGALPARNRAFMETLGSASDKKPIICVSGYGLTESTGVVTVPDEHDLAATVGRVIPGTAVGLRKIDDEHEELIVTGPGIAQYLDDQLQQELIPNGVLRTGDIGEIHKYICDARGEVITITLKDRMKRMMKVRGVSVLPGPIERALMHSDLIEEVLLLSKDEERLGALIVPAVDYMKAHPEEFNFDVTNMHSQHLRSVMHNEVKKFGARENTHQRAVIDSFWLVPEFPEILRTEARKLKYKSAEVYFRNVIEAMWMQGKMS